MRRLAWRTTVIVATAMGLIGLWRFSGIVLLVLLSLMLAAILRPLVETLTRWGLPRWAALGGAFAGSGVAVLLLGYFAVTAMVQDLAQAGHDLAASYGYIQQHWPKGNGLQQALVARLPAMESFPKALAEMPLGTAAQQVLGVSFSIFELAANLLIIAVLSIYWSANQHRFERLWLSLLPIEERIWARELWRRIESEVGRYMASEILQSILAGVLLAVLLRISGFPYPGVVAILAALAWLIPWVGPTLAITAIWFAAFVSFADTTTTAVITRGVVGSVLTLAVYLALEFLVQPRLQGERRYSSLLIALVALGMADLLGLVGLVLGPPVAATIQLVLEQYFWPTTNEPANGAGSDLGSLRARLNDLRSSVPPEDLVPMASILERAGSLLDEAQSLVGTPEAVALSPASGAAKVPPPPSGLLKDEPLQSP